MSITDLSKFVGVKLLKPIPSISEVVMLPRLRYSGRAISEAKGSTAIIVIPSFLSFSFRPIPVIVPPVPHPQTYININSLRVPLAKNFNNLKHLQPYGYHRLVHPIFPQLLNHNAPMGYLHC